MRNKFKGYYFKHQKNDKVVAFIPGKAESGAFIQVITNKKSYQYNFENAQMKTNPYEIKLEDCAFSRSGLKINLPEINGEIRYTGITPIKSDIMGIFKFFPMECRHGIISMRHNLHGSLQIEQEHYDFDGGTGYIEFDEGRSFPEKYIWIQANDFSNKESFMLSIAKIPFCGVHFEGCICVLITEHKEYRLATYYGAKTYLSENEIVIRQGRLILKVTVLSEGKGHPLAAPQHGKMIGMIRENNDAKIRLALFDGDKTICSLESSGAGYENHGYHCILHNI